MNIGIVGAGRMGRERARSATVCGAAVKWICDPLHERAVKLSQEFGAAALSTADPADLSGIDALMICTPPGSRGSLGIAAINAGVPLFLEKPLGLSAAHCAALAESLRRMPVVNAVGYMNRYRASVARARERIQQGSPIAASFHWLGTQYKVPWWLEIEQSGGPLNEQCTHFIDLCRFLLGEVAEVQAVSRPLSGKSSVEGTLAMTLRFSNGLLATGLYGCEATQKQIGFDVYLPDTAVRLAGWDLRLEGDAEAALEAGEEDIFVKETGIFLDAVRTGDGSRILSNIESALETQRVVDQLKSARSKETEAAVCA